jgi:hypothetical protein
MSGCLAALVQIVGGRIFCGNAIFLIGPGPQINQFTAFGAERTKRVVLIPFHGFLTGGAFYVHGGLVSGIQVDADA